MSPAVMESVVLSAVSVKVSVSAVGVKAVAAAVAAMTQEQIAELETNGKLQLDSYEILSKLRSEERRVGKV